MANKREYMQANKEWLKNKAKEEGVEALPGGSTLIFDIELIGIA